MRRRVIGLVLVTTLIACTAAAIAPAGAARPALPGLAGPASEPAAPGAPIAAPSDHSARVSWAAPDNHGSAISIYLVTPYLGSRAQPTRSFHSNKTSVLVTGLTNGRKYTFRVAAHNGAGTGPMSVASAAVRIGAPRAPTRLTVAPGNGQATVSWATPLNDGSAITIYIVTPFLGPKAMHAIAFHSSATSGVVTGLVNGQSYSFRVAAHNAWGTGPQSSTAGPVRPTAATSISVATIGSQSILVNAYGQALYLYTPDGTSATTKTYAGLEFLWPPVAWSGTPTVGAGLDPGKVAVQVQRDGTRQVAYNGHLLYTFLYDSPGSATGDGVSNFRLVSATGEAV